MNVWWTASPNLALIKYWGKASAELNIPATSSLGISLDGFYSRSSAEVSDRHEVFVDGKSVELSRYESLFEAISHLAGKKIFWKIESENNFPQSAGFASSSSGLAALVAACLHAVGLEVSLSQLSSLARLGSASASRAVFPGWSIFLRESKYAEGLHHADYWPSLRVVALMVQKTPKAISSREAMERVRLTSPFYGVWLEKSQSFFGEALYAVENRDLERLGYFARKSYLSMFSTMLTSLPPIIYWQGLSVDLLQACEEWRKQGLGVWETMDAGPQVKLLCEEKDWPQLEKKLHVEFPLLEYHVLTIGGGIKMQEGSL